MTELFTMYNHSNNQVMKRNTNNPGDQKQSVKFITIETFHEYVKNKLNR